jgi:hypothetical protein
MIKSINTNIDGIINKVGSITLIIDAIIINTIKNMNGIYFFENFFFTLKIIKNKIRKIYITVIEKTNVGLLPITPIVPFPFIKSNGKRTSIIIKNILHILIILFITLYLFSSYKILIIYRNINAGHIKKYIKSILFKTIILSLPKSL